MLTLQSVQVNTVPMRTELISLAILSHFLLLDFSMTELQLTSFSETVLYFHSLCKLSSINTYVGSG